MLDFVSGVTVVTPFDVLKERMLTWSFADRNATTHLLDLVGAVTGMIVVMPFDVLSGGISLEFTSNDRDVTHLLDGFAVEALIAEAWDDSAAGTAP